MPLQNSWTKCGRLGDAGSIQKLVRPSGHSSVRPSGHSSLCPSGHSSVLPSVHSSVWPFFRPPVWLFFRSPVWPFFRLTFLLSVRSFFHPSPVYSSFVNLSVRIFLYPHPHPCMFFSLQISDVQSEEEEGGCERLCGDPGHSPDIYIGGISP